MRWGRRVEEPFDVVGRVANGPVPDELHRPEHATTSQPVNGRDADPERVREFGSRQQWAGGRVRRPHAAEDYATRRLRRPLTGGRLSHDSRTP